MFDKSRGEDPSVDIDSSGQNTSVMQQFSGENQQEYYRQKNLQNWRKIESHSFFRAISATLGGLTKKSVCDLGCGNGYYGRECLEKGADYVVGFDLSEDMVNEANRLIKDPKKEKYQVGNVLEIKSNTQPKESFDIVLVVYLWNYATNSEQLKHFMEVAFWLLKKNGVAFVVTDNKTNIPDYRKFAKYGMFRDPNFISAQDDIDGLKIDYIFGENIATGHRLTNYRMSRDTFIASAQKVGFSIKAHDLVLPSELQKEIEDWQEFLDTPPLEIYSLSKF